MPYSKEYYNAHREAILESSRRWRKANHEKCLEYSRKSKARNRDKIRARVREYYEKNRQAILEQKRSKRAGFKEVEDLTLPIPGLDDIPNPFIVVKKDLSYRARI